MNKKHKFRRCFRALVAFFLLAFLAGAGSLGYWSYAPAEKTCLSCHEISDAYDTWAASFHREIPCRHCHGTALSSGIHSLTEKAHMVVGHFTQERHDDIRLGEGQVIAMVDRCKGCHESEYADWIAGGHSATYADLFLNEEHNKAELLSPDCLRCHGMFFEGAIEDLVEPLDIEGPWRLRSSERAALPAIPCLACHQFHKEGTPARRPDYAQPGRIAAARAERVPNAGYYFRYDKMHFAAASLPIPKIWEADRPVTVSPDARQRLCVQCHAPDASHQAGAGDDRTPLGVHEGISCTVCHDTHSNETRQSCVTCHPALSNCGLDVAAMDTTYKDPNSPNNIHFVKCAGCHDKAFLNQHGRA